MRLAANVALALGVALPAPIAANAFDGVAPIHKHRIHMHQAVHGLFNVAATALTPPLAIVPVAPAAKSDDNSTD
jgi:hypothetical protein